jgi:hypothetical protein
LYGRLKGEKMFNLIVYRFHFRMFAKFAACLISAAILFNVFLSFQSFNTNALNSTTQISKDFFNAVAVAANVVSEIGASFTKILVPAKSEKSQTSQSNESDKEIPKQMQPDFLSAQSNIKEIQNNGGFFSLSIAKNMQIRSDYDKLRCFSVFDRSVVFKFFIMILAFIISKRSRGYIKKLNDNKIL